jgi:hypothetical protein
MPSAIERALQHRGGETREESDEGGGELGGGHHEAAVTFLIGLRLLGAVLAGRPLPIGRIFKAPPADPHVDRVLGLMIGALLVCTRSCISSSPSRSLRLLPHRRTLGELGHDRVRRALLLQLLAPPPARQWQAMPIVAKAAPGPDSSRSSGSFTVWR